MFSELPRGNSHREQRETVVEEAEPGQLKRLGTDAFTASCSEEVVVDGTVPLKKSVVSRKQGSRNVTKEQ